ncbi:MAG: PKD domain-containing protein [Nitrospirae bacterium]|nr:PKD domain-containing protein [Nitrospirota bacterium]
MLLKLTRKTLMISVSIAFTLLSGAISFAETINYVYDDLNRLTRIELEDGAKVNYFYDEVGNRLEVMRDSDGDEMPDRWEAINGLNLNDPTDAGYDYDNDGFSNLEEYRQGTHPAESIQCVDCPRNYSSSYPVSTRAIAIDNMNRPHIAYGGDHLYHAYYDGTTWRYQTVDSSPGVGQYASIAIDSNNSVHISYHDGYRLKYATNASGSWNISTIDSTPGVGQYTSIAVDSNNRVHISYYDYSNSDLKYATNESGSWVAYKINPTGDVGSYSSIAVDSNNRVHISYSEQFVVNLHVDYDLKYATNASGSWVVSTIDTAGSVGQYSSIAVDSNNKAHIGYYDWDNGDLKYATNLSGTWTISVIDSTGYVGQYSSIATDSDNEVHISYYDYTNSDLKYATNESGSWVVYTINSAGDVGTYSSITIDSNKKAHIGYYDSTNGNIKYATNTSGFWVLSAVDSIGASVGYYSSIAIDLNKKAHISYYDYTNSDLKYATNASGAWVTSTIDATGYVGQTPSIATDSNNKIHISYYDGPFNYNLKYATNASGTWVISVIDSEGDVGAYSSITIDSNNKVHISYLDATNYDLKYATNASGSWVISTIDSAGYVGAYSSIGIDSNNRLHISYFDSTNAYLKYATNASGSWVISMVDSIDYVGDYSSIAVDSNNKAHISYYDWNKCVLKYATNASGSWVAMIADGDGACMEDVGRHSSIAIDSNNNIHISYSGAGRLKYAVRTSGSWVVSTIDSSGAYTSIAVDSNNSVHISYSRSVRDGYFSSNGELAYFTNFVNNSPAANPGGPYSGVEGQVITFNGSGSIDIGGSIVLYEWDINNDGTYDYYSSSPAQSHTYTQQGAFTVKLRVTDNNGTTNEAQTNVNISDTSPAASITVLPGSGIEPLTVSLTDASTAYDGTVSRSWNFGDGSPGNSEVSVPHVYARNGAYTVTLSVTDGDGSATVKTELVTVNDALPTANFTASPTSGIAPLIVNFTDQSTGYDQPFTYLWDFDNNDTIDSTDQNPQYMYSTTGTYTVKLTVTDSDGSTNTLIRSNYITVTPSCLQPARIMRAATVISYYTTLQSAYDAAVDGDIIQSQVVLFIENLIINDPATPGKAVTFEGGYDCGYTNKTGNTELKGQVTNSKGIVKLKNFVIKK